MNADITTADVEIFRNILFEVCASKLGGLMTPEFQFGLGQIVVAVGTSLAKTHAHYAKRLFLLTSCWKEVNVTEDDTQEQQSPVSRQNSEEQDKTEGKEEDTTKDKSEQQAKEASTAGDGVKDAEKGVQE